MLASERIAKAFLAIVEEAEKARGKNKDGKVDKKLKAIISIAKHQSDVRGSKKGHCKAKSKPKCEC